MKLTIIFSTLLLLFFTSCTKEDNKEYSLNGKLFQGCTNQPLANKEIILDQRIGANWVLQTSGGEVARTTTDANGNFKFTYKAKNENDLRILVAAGFGNSSIIEGIPGKKDLNNLVVNYSATTSIQVKLNVINPHSMTDTLFITDFNNPLVKLKIAGPFISGTLYTTNGFGITNPNYENTNTVDLGYKLNNNNWIIKSFNLKACDTSRVTADIN
jgi:hypothetical protein